MTTSEHSNESGGTASKLRWLIVGRLLVAVILSVLATIWSRVGPPQLHSKSLVLLSIVAGLSFIYSLINRLYRNVLFQARLQIAVDVLLVTWLVWNSDVVHSAYIALYIVVIAISSLFLGPRDAVVTSVGCAVTFTVCAMALTGLGQPGSPGLVDGSISQTVQSVGLFDVAFLVVGLLSARLAERQSRSDVRLLAATQSLANLRALHERIVESIRSGVVTTDLEGRIYTLNAAAEEITGYQQETVRGTDASVFFGDMNYSIEASF